MSHPETIKLVRVRLRLSQSELERRAKVSRWKLNVYETGGLELNSAELCRIGQALSNEVERTQQVLREIASGRASEETEVLNMD